LQLESRRESRVNNNPNKAKLQNEGEQLRDFFRIVGVNNSNLRLDIFFVRTVVALYRPAMKG